MKSDSVTGSRRYTIRLSICLVMIGLALLTPRPAAAQVICDDATMLALELDGPTGIIQPDPSLIAIIDMQLTLIRGQLPELADIHVFPTWLPGQLLVGLNETAWAQFMAGTFTGFDDLFALYPIVDVSPFSSTEAVWIRFVDPLHAANLAPHFSAVEGVTYAEPNHVGGDGDDITIEVLGGPYTFKRGWGDCPSGCIFNHYWLVDIFGGGAVILADWGDEFPVGTEPVPWSQVKAVYR